VFDIAVIIVFQSVFCLKTHQNNIYFLFLKFIFGISTSKQLKNTKNFNFKQKN
jgi:uncharacterized protein (DUF362 family)